MSPADLDPDEFLTVADVATTLKLNQQTVRNWIDQGALPAFRVGRRVRIRRSDFQRILDESYSGPSAEAPSGPSADDFWGGEPVGVAEPERTSSPVLTERERPSSPAAIVPDQPSPDGG